MPVQLFRPSPTPLSFTTQFLKQPPSGLPWCEDFTYPRHANDSLAEFKSSEDFGVFKEKYEALLDELSEFAKDHNLHRIENIQLVKKRLFDDSDGNPYDGHKEVLFGSGKQSLGKFVALLQHDQIPFDTRKAEASNLIEDMDKCPEGVASRIATAGRNLELILCGEALCKYKEDLIKESIKEFVGAAPQMRSHSMEIHYATRLSNALASQFGLPLQEDSWTETGAVTKVVTEKDISDCREFILEKLTPVNLALHFAGACVADLKDNMRSHFPGAQSGDSEKSFELGRFYKEIKLIIDQQQSLYGDLGVENFIGSVDEDMVHYGLYPDPTLVAVKIIDSLRKAGRLEDYSQCRLYGRTLENTAITIEGLGDLIWATEDGTAVPLTAEHLRSITPHQSVEGNHRIAAKAIENSSAASLIKNLSPAWLDERQVIQLLSKAGYEEFMLFVEKHQAFFDKHYPPQDLAKIFIVHGDPAQFKAYMARYPAMFARNDAMGILSHFWDPALRQHNPQMLDAVVNLAVQAMKPTTVISMCRLETVAQLMHLNLKISDPGPASMQTAIIFQLGEILISACENNLIGSAQLASLLSKIGHRAPGLHAALAIGNHRQVAAFGNILLQAANKNLLNKQQIATLLGAHSLGFPALSHALLQKHVPAIKAFGAIVTSLYENAFLDDEQVASLLSCQAEDGYGRLINCLDYQDKNVISAYAKILMDIDSIKHSSQNKASKNAPLILTSKVQDEELRLGHFLYTRPEEILNGLILQAGALSTMHNEAASGETISNAHGSLKMEIEKIRVALFSKAFFCTQKQQRDSEALFAQLMHDWDVLQRVAP